jgi:hypothetical protein
VRRIGAAFVKKSLTLFAIRTPRFSSAGAPDKTATNLAELRSTPRDRASLCERIVEAALPESSYGPSIHKVPRFAPPAEM